MNITNAFLQFTLLGAEWVMWLLIVLSIASVAVMIERWRFFGSRKVELDGLIDDTRAALASGDRAAVQRRYDRAQSMAAAVVLSGLEAADDGVEAVAESMNSAKVRARQAYEQNLVFLGTMGNNAPFIGLFGTVLGIIRAFNDLAENPRGDATIVMSGISEALVATAIGLLVAIPAVVAFNYFNRRVRGEVVKSDSAAHAVLGALHARDTKGAKEAA